MEFQKTINLPKKSSSNNDLSKKKKKGKKTKKLDRKTNKFVQDKS